MGEVEGTACARCARVHVPARRWRCLGCGGAELRPVAVPLVGALASFTALQTKGSAAGVGIALVRLDAGPVVTGALALDGARAEVGDRVQGAVEDSVEEGRAVRRLRFAALPPPVPPAALPEGQPAPP